MEPVAAFNLYSLPASERFDASKKWVYELRAKVDVMNSSADRLSLIFDPVMRSVTRSFLSAAQLDDQLSDKVSLHRTSQYPRLTLSRVFEAITLDICKEILSEEDLRKAAQLLCDAPKTAVGMLEDAQPIAA